MKRIKAPLFRSSRMLSTDPSFTGRGFMPDLFSDGRMSTLAHASRTTLENGFVPGSEGTLPPPASMKNLRAVQPGQGQDTGSGGAGSFGSSFAQ